MYRSVGTRRGLAALASWIALSAPGCDRPPGLNPSAESARAGLEAALTAWREGRSPASLIDGEPPIQVVDSEWAGGRKLAAFAILRDEPSAADKRFAVKLSYATPRAEAEARFIVLGSRPLSIFREEDYDRSMNMDNGPTPKKKR